MRVSRCVSAAFMFKVIVGICLLMGTASSLRISPLKMMGNNDVPKSPSNDMRQQVINTATKLLIPTATSLASVMLLGRRSVLADDAINEKRRFEYQPALQGLDYGKPRTVYPDFVQKPSGLQYKVVKEGTGSTPAVGDRVVVDWEGYTIGYYGRPFQTRGKVKGGAFDSPEGENFRWVVGSGAAVAALDEGIRYMKEGGITQIIVPAELGYPVGDPEHDLVGPKPSTFSGMRALNFVLDNKNLIDKTLLLNVKLVRVDKTDKGKFKRNATQ